MKKAPVAKELLLEKISHLKEEAGEVRPDLLPSGESAFERGRTCFIVNKHGVIDEVKRTSAIHAAIGKHGCSVPPKQRPVSDYPFTREIREAVAPENLLVFINETLFAVPNDQSGVVFKAR